MPSRRPPGWRPAPNFEIRGKVSDEKSGAPIARASVSLKIKGNPNLTGAIVKDDGW